jgi:hypothetical protein
LSSETWPSSGTMQDGRSWPLPRLAPRINGIGGGALLPTLMASEGGSNRSPGGKVRPTLSTMARRGLLPNHPIGPLSPTWAAWLMGWPIEATKLGPLEMARYLSARRRPGKSLAVPRSDVSESSNPSPPASP